MNFYLVLMLISVIFLPGIIGIFIMSCANLNAQRTKAYSAARHKADVYSGAASHPSLPIIFYIAVFTYGWVIYKAMTVM
ncbi:hypothetical protein ACT5AY_001475 [Pseudomonas aeruginosa]|uniref:hypothetical protein n=1 Tax=Pseudomonas aeruginosa group TaxID=136841 RepID=UPI000AD13226|nr:hypothetical protein [Pseudomonas paraeruginosa]MBG5165524.1 hypothetical protein [Pseudomonas aeruginosa]MBH3771483.1 hypothetical protein [Pseudomonas aeruginosa]RTT26695.1 hypothetical protein DY956_30245 [Pseudomonas paraeruginosa]HEK1481310.1 hypothetical protein [Pseudomonas aeruginosa]